MTLLKNRSLTLLVVSLSALLLSACNDSDNPFGCLVNDRPVLNTDNLRQPTLNQVFESSISVSIQNNDRDDEYTYLWDLTGDLPPGIAYEVDDRVLSFTGTATSLGEYTYTVRVRVRDGIDSDDDGSDADFLCRDEVERIGRMTVIQEM